jgi:TolB-like protein/tetratricopeptide (TPR) repeat protein
MANILAELKRRNVFKVATIYVVVSWLLLQVAATVFPIFDIPLWASRLLVLLLGLGFPIAVVLAWAFDLTPEGIQWQTDEGAQHVHTHAWDWVLAVLLIVAIGLMVSSQLDRWEVDNARASTPSRGADLPSGLPSDSSVPGSGDAVVSELNSVAVLPFDNLSAEPGDEYFADGLAEELLSVLGRVSEIRVASRTSTAYYKNKDIDNATIASTLQVDNVLSGSVRRAGDRIRVTAALDAAGSGQLLWSDTYDRTLDDILDIQSDIARSVVSAIVPVLSPESESQIDSRPTENSEAYDFYLRGRDYLRQPATSTTFSSAVELFNRAIGLDPRFAQAYAGRCEANLGSYEYTRDSAFFSSAEQSCHRALTLNNSLWDVHVALGNLYKTNGQYDEAILELEAAIEQQPNAVAPYLALANTYVDLERLEDADATFRRAEKVESGYWGVHNQFGHLFYKKGEYDEAIRRYRKVIELAPDHGIGHDNLGNVYLAIGDLDSAEQAFSDSPYASRWTYTNRGLVYYYKGEFAKAAEDQQRAIDISSEDHRAWGRLADAYRFIPGREDDAKTTYEAAIRLAAEDLTINPSRWDSIARLAMYYAHTAESDLAEEQIDKLFELTSDSTAYYFAAIASLSLGESARAYDFVRRSIEGGFSKSLIRADPDLIALNSEAGYETLLAE